MDSYYKDSIEASTKATINLNKNEIETIKNNIAFSTWMFTILSAGFILFINNKKDVTATSSLFGIQTSTVFLIITVIFVFYFLLTINYRIFSLELIGKYSLNSSYLSAQKFLLLENLNLIPVKDLKSNIFVLILISKLCNFSYLEDDIKDSFNNETKLGKIGIMLSLTYWTLVIGFILEYILIILILS